MILALTVGNLFLARHFGGRAEKYRLKNTAFKIRPQKYRLKNTTSTIPRVLYCHNNTAIIIPRVVNLICLLYDNLIYRLFCLLSVIKVDLLWVYINDICCCGWLLQEKTCNYVYYSLLNLTFYLILFSGWLYYYLMDCDITVVWHKSFIGLSFYSLLQYDVNWNCSISKG